MAHRTQSEKRAYRRETVDYLRREVERLRAERDSQQRIAIRVMEERNDANARAERAEALLCDLRALAVEASVGGLSSAAVIRWIDEVLSDDDFHVDPPPPKVVGTAKLNVTDVRRPEPPEVSDDD